MPRCSEGFQSLKTIKIMKFSVNDAEMPRFFTLSNFGRLIQKPLIINIMRICVVPILVLATSLQLLAATRGNSQSIAQTKVNLELKNASLLDAFSQIESQTAFRFAYHKKDVKDVNGLNLSAQNQTVA